MTKTITATITVTLDDEEYAAQIGDPEAPGRIDSAKAEIDGRIRAMIHRNGLVDGDFVDEWKLEVKGKDEPDPSPSRIENEAKTVIRYYYRDGNDEKSPIEGFVLNGTVSGETLAAIRLRAGADTETEYGEFIPGQVGLPDLQEDHWYPEVDHPMHQIVEIKEGRGTIDDTYVDMDAEELAQAIASTEWDRSYMPEYVDIVSDDADPDEPSSI